MCLSKTYIAHFLYIEALFDREMVPNRNRVRASENVHDFSASKASLTK